MFLPGYFVVEPLFLIPLTRTYEEPYTHYIFKIFDQGKIFLSKIIDKN